MSTNAPSGDVVTLLKVLDLEYAVDPEETTLALNAIADYFERTTGRLDRS